MATMGSRKAGRRARRQFTEEFMAGAVRLVLDEGKTVGAVARELDLTPSSLGNWVKHAQADRTKGKTGLTTVEREELARLRKENRVLRSEEHTSELQSPCNLVCRLLLEKKKQLPARSRATWRRSCPHAGRGLHA